MSTTTIINKEDDNKGENIHKDAGVATILINEEKKSQESEKQNSVLQQVEKDSIFSEEDKSGCEGQDKKQQEKHKKEENDSKAPDVTENSKESETFTNKKELTEKVPCEIPEPHSPLNSDTVSQTEEPGKQTKIRVVESKIEHFINVGGNATIGGFITDQEKKNDSKKRQDRLPHREQQKIPIQKVSIDLPDRTILTDALTTADVSSDAQTLEEKNVLIVSCVDMKIAWATVYDIVEKFNSKSNINKRLLDVNAYTIEVLNQNTSIIERLKNDNKNPVLLVMDLANEKCNSIAETLISCSHGAAGAQRAKLKSMNLFLICVVHRNMMDLLKKTSDSENLAFSFLKIDYIPPFLKRHIGIDYEHYIPMIREQFKNGLWGKDDANRHDLLAFHAINGTLRSQLENPSNTKTLRPITAELLFENADLLKHIVLFTAAYFSKSTPSEFDEIVKFFSGDEKMELTVTEEFIGKDGKKRTIEKKTINLISSIWEKEGREYLEKCQIIGKKIDNEGLVMGFFKFPYLEADIRSHIETYYQIPFLIRQFRFIRQSNLLFKSTRNLNRSVINLMVLMACMEPDRYGSDWLHDVFSGLAKQVELKIPENAAPDEVLQHVALEFAKDIQKKSEVLNIMCTIIEKMIERDELVTLIENFAKNLLDRHLEILLLSVIQRLWKSPLFIQRRFDWLQMILDRSDEDVYEIALEFLLNIVKDEECGFFEILNSIYLWLPAKNEKAETILPSCRFALQFVKTFCMTFTLGLQLDLYGKPLKLLLFKEIDVDNCEKNIEFLIHCLWQPSNNLMINNIDEVFFNATLISEWVLLIFGFIKKIDIRPELLCTDNDEKDLPFEMKQTIVKEIIRQTFLYTTRDQQKRILEFWRELSDYLLIKSDVIRKSEPMNALNFDRRRKQLSFIIRTLNEYRNNSSKPSKRIIQ